MGLCLKGKGFNSDYSKGRLKEFDEDEGYNINPYYLDYVKILNSKGLRRELNKTQVFITPENKHIRNRLIHTNEVVANSVLLSGLLGLNTELSMSIALGHDIGHCPFGHLTEDLFTQMLRDDYGDAKFHHSLIGLVVLELIERKGKGLNLTHETLEGILYHSTGTKRFEFNQSIPQEYSIVLISDKISYLFSDFNDTIRMGFLINDDDKSRINELVNWFGYNQRMRVKKCVNAVINESCEKGYVSFSEGIVYERFYELLRLMYKGVYFALDKKLSVQKQKMSQVISVLKESTVNDYLRVISDYVEAMNIELPDNPVKPDDYLLASLLTDDEVNKFELNKITLERVLKAPTIMEILPYMLTERTSADNMMNFYRSYGQVSDKIELFSRVKPLLSF